jgi:hypothetical protein
MPASLVFIWLTVKLILLLVETVSVEVILVFDIVLGLKTSAGSKYAILPE